MLIFYWYRQFKTGDTLQSYRHKAWNLNGFMYLF